VLRVERGVGPARSLPLPGRWVRAAEGPLRFVVDGDVLDGEDSLPTTGTLLVWPRRTLGQLIGVQRISLDVMMGRTRLRLDGEVGPPPYWRGVALPARVDQGSRTDAARVSIDPLQLLALWLDLSLSPDPPADPAADRVPTEG
jgi:hypothetical protein